MKIEVDATAVTDELFKAVLDEIVTNQVKLSKFVREAYSSPAAATMAMLIYAHALCTTLGEGGPTFDELVSMVQVASRVGNTSS